MSYFIKKNLLLYKNLVKYLASRQNLSVKKSGSVNKCIKFEIKLYLLALSFNRFIFNFDKILFMLCIITNFLYFLSFQHPRVLFFGEYTTTFECMFKKAARDCNQIYYSKCLLPGSITNIEPIDFYYERFGNNIFTKNLDCVLTFFSNPVSQELKEITTLGIPIIGLVEINAINLFGITHPIVCTRSISSVYFFSNYFSKLLNTNTELYNSPKIRYRRNGIRLLSSFSSSAKTQVQGLEFSKLITDDIFFINRLIFFLGISKPLFLRNTFLLKKPRNSECFVEFKNRFVDFLNYLFLYIRFTTKFIPGWFIRRMRAQAKDKRRRMLGKKLLSTKTKRRFLLRRLTDCQRDDLKLLVYIKKLKNVRRRKRRRFFKTFNFTTWARNLRKVLKTKNIYANRSLVERDKRFFLREFIIADLRKYGITTELLRLKNEVISNKYPYIEKYVRKPYIPRPVVETRHVKNSWAYKKWKLFTFTYIPKKRKKIKRLKLLWDLRFITKLQKKGGNKYYFYTKKPRARILKKKFLIKKLVNYYYNFSFSKKIRSLLVFTKKLKNKVTTEYGLNLMNTFESHLSVFVLRCKYVSNMLDSKSLITSGGVLVNGVIVYNPGYVLNTCDIVQLNKFQVPLFIRRFLRINKPQRWKKNRYFYRLTTRNELSEIIYNKRLYRRMVKLRKRGIIMYHKFYWKKRKFSPTFFKKRFYLNFLPIQQY